MWTGAGSLQVRADTWSEGGTPSSRNWAGGHRRPTQETGQEARCGDQGVHPEGLQQDGGWSPAHLHLCIWLLGALLSLEMDFSQYTWNFKSESIVIQTLWI